MNQRRNEVIVAWENYIDGLDPLNMDLPYQNLKKQIRDEPKLKTTDKKYILEYAEEKLIKQTKGDKVIEQVNNESEGLKEEIAALKRQLKRKDRRIEKLELAVNPPSDNDIKAAKMREIFEDVKISKDFSIKRLAALHDDFRVVRGRAYKTSKLRVTTNKMTIDYLCRLFRKMAKMDEAELEILRQSM